MHIFLSDLCYFWIRKSFLDIQNSITDFLWEKNLILKQKNVNQSFYMLPGNLLTSYKCFSSGCVPGFFAALEWDGGVFHSKQTRTFVQTATLKSFK